MTFPYFSHNGILKPVAEAVISVSNIAYAYGFGVYETIRVTKGIVYFRDDHIERLMHSAKLLGLEHPFTEEFVTKSIEDLIKKNKIETCNLKLLLIGGQTREDASLFMLCLNPLFPDRKLYKEGASVITVHAERVFPHAKSLNMLQSYLAYRKAKQAGAYDALLINRGEKLVEGTRTNLFGIIGKTLISPPEDEILLGVTRKAVLHVAAQAGYSLESKEMSLGDIFQYDGAFLTSTSSKIIPLQSIDGNALPPIPESLKELMRHFDQFLLTCNGKL